MTFFYSFLETLLHSIWQTALLLCVYLFVINIARNYHPLQKRNFLYLLLLSQFCVSVVTFISFFYGYNFAVTIGFTTPFQNTQLLLFNSYDGVIFTFYLFVVLVKILQTGIQWSVFKKGYLQEVVRPTACLKVFTEFHSHQLNLKKKVTLWFSHTIKTPVTFGFFKPVILLPISLLNNITTLQAEIIILHELIHIKSRDYLFNWFLLFMETIYFFNPFIKIAAEMLKLEREKNCDIQVLNYQYSSIKYAETLYEIAQNNTFLKRFHLGVFKNSSQLYKRISFFSEHRNKGFKNLNYFSLIFFAFLLTGSICFFMLAKTSSTNTLFTNAPTNAFEELYQKNKIITLPLYEEEMSVSKKNKYLSVRKAKRNIAKDLTKTSVLDFAKDENQTSYIPVSLQETTDSSKEVIYYIEGNKTTITQSYKVIRRNGILVFEPQWMIKVTRDSTSPKMKIDSTVLIQIKEIQ